MTFKNLFVDLITKIDNKNKHALEEFFNQLKIQTINDNNSGPSDQYSTKKTAPLASKLHESQEVQEAASIVERIFKKQSKAISHFINKIQEADQQKKIGTLNQTKSKPNNYIADANGSTFPLRPVDTSPSLQKNFIKYSSKSQQYNNSHYSINPEVNQTEAKSPNLSDQPQKIGNHSSNLEQTTNESPQKSAGEVLAELQQFHKKASRKMKEESHKAIKRSKIIKINQQMISKTKELKKKDAQDKIKVNLEFLQSLKIPINKQTPSFKQFRNFLSNQQKQGIRIKNAKNINEKRIFNFDSNYTPKSNQSKNKIIHLTGSQIIKDTNESIDSPIKLPPIQPRKGAIKPPAYSIYSIYQKPNQLFINSALKLF